MSAGAVAGDGAAPGVGRALGVMVEWRAQSWSVLVVGGGPIGTRRARAFAAAGARVTVVALRALAELRELAAADALQLVLRAFEPGDLAGQRAVVVAIDDPREARSIAALARERGQLVHVADVPELCDFVFPAVAARGPLQVAVSSAGRAPALAARLRDHLERALPPGAEQAVEHYARMRSALRSLLPDASLERGRRLGALAERSSIAELAALDGPGFARRLWELAHGVPTEGTTMATRAPATANEPARVRAPVVLVGAGPGGAQGLTARAREALELAELVLADRTVAPELLALVRGELYVAEKLPGACDRSQRELERRMLSAAQQGRRVVRLKEGDPCVFGRAGEELEACARAGLECELAPGLSSALAAPALCGVALTERGVADRIVIATAHGAHDREPDLPHYRAQTSYVFLMGLRQLERLSARLIAAGFPPQLPGLVVSQAGRKQQRAVCAPLAELAERTRVAGLAAPATIVLGQVVALAERRRATFEYNSGERNSGERDLRRGAGERPFEVVDQVLGIFDADAQPDEVLG